MFYANWQKAVMQFGKVLLQAKKRQSWTKIISQIFVTPDTDNQKVYVAYIAADSTTLGVPHTQINNHFTQSGQNFYFLLWTLKNT